MKEGNKKRIFGAELNFLVFILIILLVVYLLSKISPEEIVGFLGVRNSYFLVFLLAIIGGASFLSATSFYATIVTLVLGGVSPFWAAFFAAPGILLGDLLFWYVGVRTRPFIEENFGEKHKRFTGWLKEKPRKSVLSVIYLYTGFTPLPGDLLMIGLALAGYRFREIWLPTILGNFTLVFIVGHAALYGPNVFTTFL